MAEKKIYIRGCSGQCSTCDQTGCDGNFDEYKIEVDESKENSYSPCINCGITGCDGKECPQ